tara:strand:- start:5228 stop:5893 length:666 start_codon:yes stop_codon:yes gene_type:complete
MTISEMVGINKPNSTVHHPWPKGQDPQQYDMYAAERSVDWEKYDRHRKDMSLEECWTMANKLLLRKTFQLHYPKSARRLSVPKGKPQRFGYGMDLYVAAATESKYHAMQSGLRIGPANRGGFASHNGKTIGLATWGRQSYVVIHELAHIIDMNENGRANLVWHQPHGWQFCRIMLRLIHTYYGREAHDDLRQAFKDHIVRYKSPTKRQLRPHEPDPKLWVV